MKADQKGVRIMRILFSIRSLFMTLVMLTLSAASFAQIGVAVSINFAPPELPVYEQPLCPGEGYFWTPGYWAWGDDDYYWVPGTWVLAPEVCFFWTPGYWAWGGSSFIFYEGYWGPVVGFYGGINYGYGYFGRGYEGGYWNRGAFYYNRSVNNVSTTNITNVYSKTVINNVSGSHVSYNGGSGGTTVRPTAAQLAAARERRAAATAAQTQQVRAARTNRAQFASVNHGRPTVAATAKPGVFTGRGVV